MRNNVVCEQHAEVKIWREGYSARSLGVGWILNRYSVKQTIIPCRLV